jgi:hypothetical protein
VALILDGTHVGDDTMFLQQIDGVEGGVGARARRALSTWNGPGRTTHYHHPPPLTVDTAPGNVVGDADLNGTLVTPRSPKPMSVVGQ